MACIVANRVLDALEAQFADTAQRVRLHLPPADGVTQGAEDMSLAEVRKSLVSRASEDAWRDAVWSELIVRAQDRSETWKLAAIWMMVPGLRKISGLLHRRCTFVDIREIDSEILLGFTEALLTVDPHRERPSVHLWWAAYRRGATVWKQVYRERPTDDIELVTRTSPDDDSFTGMLGDAVSEGVISVPEADLIGRTRIEGERLGAIAERMGLRYHACRQRRARAEGRLAGYLRNDRSEVGAPPPGGRRGATTGNVS